MNTCEVGLCYMVMYITNSCCFFSQKQVFPRVSGEEYHVPSAARAGIHAQEWLLPPRPQAREPSV